MYPSDHVEGNRKEDAMWRERALKIVYCLRLVMSNSTRIDLPLVHT